MRRRSFTPCSMTSGNGRCGEYPELATSIGDPRYNDRLTDFAGPAFEARKAHKRDLLKRIGEIDRGSLSGQDALSYDLFLQRDRPECRRSSVFLRNVMPISQMAAFTSASPNCRALRPCGASRILTISSPGSKPIPGRSTR